jgi:hypothetical protein
MGTIEKILQYIASILELFKSNHSENYQDAIEQKKVNKTLKRYYKAHSKAQMELDEAKDNHAKYKQKYDSGEISDKKWNRLKDKYDDLINIHEAEVQMYEQFIESLT